MTVVSSNKERIFQERLLEKYGGLPEFADLVDILGRIQTDTASDNDYIQYADKVPILIRKFKSDLRTIEPDNYKKEDILLIATMIDANSSPFESSTESFSKVIPANTVKDMLALQRKKGENIEFSTPQMTGFMALSRYSENLSPQQQQSQFGLDYQDSPYLVESIRQPFVFVTKTPTQAEIDREPNEKLRAEMQQKMDAIRNAAKLPIDPRVLVKIVEIAEKYSNDPESSKVAQNFLKKYLSTDQILPTFRDEASLTTVEKCLSNMDINSSYYESFEKVYKQVKEKAKVNQSPYTGNTAPQFGSILENHSPYADVVQERAMSQALELPPSTKIYLQVPRLGTNPLSSATPAGFEEIEVAVYNGKEWKTSFANNEIDRKIDAALQTIPEDARKKFIQNNRVLNTSNQPDDRSSLGMTTNLKKWQRTGSKRRKIENDKNSQNLEMVAKETLQCIAKHPDKVLPEKAKNVDFKPLIEDKNQVRKRKTRSQQNDSSSVQSKVGSRLRAGLGQNIAQQRKAGGR